MIARRAAAGAAIVAGLVLLGAGGWASAAGKPLLTITVKGNGRVVGLSGRISCPRKCRAQLSVGTVVRLSARAGKGSAFAGWGGACKVKATICTLRLRGPARVVANFSASAPLPPPPPPPPPVSGFTPAAIVGTWDGTWQNQTFGTSGPAKFVVAQPSATSFTFQASLGGNVFGCSTPPATSGEITEGTGVNHWNADGFSIQTTGGAGGAVSVAYDFKANKFTGSGTSGCNPNISWSLVGSFTGNTFSGTVSITLGGGGSATSVLNLTRS